MQTVVDGETIKGVYPHLGYIHRGMEKMSESMTYPQTLALTDRLNYLCAMMQRHALVGVIEEGMGIELSDRILGPDGMRNRYLQDADSGRATFDITGPLTSIEQNSVLKSGRFSTDVDGSAGDGDSSFKTR